MNIFIIWTPPSLVGTWAATPWTGVCTSTLTWAPTLGCKSGGHFTPILSFFMSKQYFFRKLFEPQKFPDAAINEIFQKYFFSNNNTDIDNLEVRRDQIFLERNIFKGNHCSMRFVLWAGSRTLCTLRICGSSRGVTAGAATGSPSSRGPGWASGGATSPSPPWTRWATHRLTIITLGWVPGSCRAFLFSNACGKSLRYKRGNKGK